MTWKSILVIDDEEIMRELISDTLEEEDYEIYWAGDGKEGMEMAKKHNPSLIILDLKMPVMNGIEMLESIDLSPASQFAVIVLTGHGYDEDIKRCFHLGVCAFLRKPFNVYEFKGLVRCTMLTKQYEELQRKSNEKLTLLNTQLSESVREREILLKEIHHRVKNNLQVISSLLYLQSEEIGDAQTLELFEANRSRIHTMATVHDFFYHSGDLGKVDFKEYTDTLVKTLLGSYKMRPLTIDVKTDIQDVFLDIVKAIPCGLIINELITVLLKHAHSNGSHGEILVSLQQLHDSDKIKLIVSDSGINFLKTRKCQKEKDLAMQLVEVLARQLNGTTDFCGSDESGISIVFGK